MMHHFSIYYIYNVFNILNKLLYQIVLLSQVLQHLCTYEVNMKNKNKLSLTLFSGNVAEKAGNTDNAHTNQIHN